MRRVVGFLMVKNWFFSRRDRPRAAVFSSPGNSCRADAQRFARIHRRIIVALDRVRGIAPQGVGQATLRLGDGTELRLSHGFRSNVSEKLWR